jgi:hypothetical protein
MFAHAPLERGAAESSLTALTRAIGGRLLGLKDVVPADSVVTWHSDYAIAILLTLCRLQEAGAPPPRTPNPPPPLVLSGHAASLTPY